MSDPLVSRLRALCNSNAGNYDIRLLAGEAATEINRLRGLLREMHQTHHFNTPMPLFEKVKAEVDRG